MGETLGISHNVFEKAEREKDRKERLKKFEDWQKEKVKKKQRLRTMRERLKEVEKTASNSNGSSRTNLNQLDATNGSDDETENDKVEVKTGFHVEIRGVDFIKRTVTTRSYS